MLVLTRMVGEHLVIGEDITVEVLEVRGNVVRLGVEAPRSVPVHREEVAARIAEASAVAWRPEPS